MANEMVLAVLVVTAACSGGSASSPREPAGSVAECTVRFYDTRCEIISGSDGCPEWYGSVNTCPGPEVPCCGCQDWAVTGVCRVSGSNDCVDYHFADTDDGRLFCEGQPPETSPRWTLR